MTKGDRRSGDDSTPPRRGWRLGGGRAAAVAIVLVVAIDALALVSIVTARREAETAARAELGRRTAAQARAIEALLATLRADLAFLATSPRLAVSQERLAADDPLSRRWARLEAEGTLLLFAEGHPPLVILELSSPDGQRLATVTRLDVPGDLEADPLLTTSAPAPPERALSLSVPVEGVGEIRGVVDPERILATVLPEGAAAEGLRIVSGLASDEGADAARETIDTRGWLTAAPLALARSPDDGALLAAVGRLASRWRLTVLLNVVVISLGLPLGILAVRSARRGARLAAQRDHAEDRRELERRLWHQERLATVGRMASGIAHEINNPLAGLANHLTLLGEDLVAEDVDSARSRVPRLAQGVERIRSIVQRALGLANPGGGHHEPVDLAEVVEETLALVAGDEPTNLRLRVEAAAGELVVAGERAMLGQLVTNLVLNALGFADGQPVDVVLARDGDACVLAVEDRGPGIDPSVAERLFEPFVSSRGSTGLGLAVCLGIVNEHGGSIVGENRSGGGARFEVRLPRSASDSRRSDPPREGSA